MKLVKQNVLPSALHRADVTGVDNEILANIKLAAAACATPRAVGRNLDIALHISGVHLLGRQIGYPDC